MLLFFVGTEDNFTYRSKSDNPDKIFFPVNILCEGMNKITLEKVKETLEKMENKVVVPEETREKAVIALDKMLKVL
ncbi:MAG: quinolinate synthase NadA [Prolixibacteraceae bacterium]|nr:quinolinate synthase NadA [Prolixibacteraceae bacterium]